MQRALLAVVVLVGCKRADAPTAAEGPTPPAPPRDAAPAIVADAAGKTVALVVDAPAPDAAPLDAALTETPCTTAAIKAVRKQADALVKAGKPDDAVALLDEGSCYLDTDQAPDLQAQIAWRISDRAFALFKAGLFERCYAAAASQLLPYSGNVAEVFDEDHAVMKALSHNADICHAAIEKQRGVFIDSLPCSFDENARAIPPAVIGGGAETCITIAPGTKDADDLNVCGEISLLRATSGGKPKRTKLVAEDGSLTDGGVCCNLADPSFQKHGGTWRVLYPSEGRNCDGGTASLEAEDVYELSGTKLVLVHHSGAVHH